MAVRLTGPAESYTVHLFAFCPARGDGSTLVRREAATGEPLPGAAVMGKRGAEEGEAPWPEYLVTMPGAVSLKLRACPDGLTVRDLRVEAAGTLTLLARVQAGGAAPDWLPPCTDYVLFHGHRREAPPGLHILFRPRDPTAQPATSLGQLVTALGKSVAQANARLARLRGAGGTALAASVTVRVAVAAFGVTAADRVHLHLAPQGESSHQHLEVTLSAVPTEEGETDA